MIKDDNYIVIPAWAVSKLKLKGVSLMIYSIIFGFCQDGESCFHGSLEYLQEWTNSTRQGVINSLRKLQEDKLIIKEDAKPNNKYYIKDLDNVNKVYNNSKQILLEDGKQSLQNNININNNIDNNYNKEKELQEKVDLIIKYLNNKCSTSFKTSSSATKRLIKARLKDGAKLQDFYDVIDFKWKEWGEKPSKFSNGQWSSIYLRPSTLFGNKMEEYIQQAWLSDSSEQSMPKSVEKLEERSDLQF